MSSFPLTHPQLKLSPTRRRHQRRRRKRNRRVALSYDHATPATSLDIDMPATSKVLSLSTDDAWDCAPSIGWVIMYFVLVGMVAVNLRFDPKPLFAS